MNKVVFVNSILKVTAINEAAKAEKVNEMSAEAAKKLVEEAFKSEVQSARRFDIR